MFTFRNKVGTFAEVQWRLVDRRRDVETLIDVRDAAETLRAIKEFPQFGDMYVVRRHVVTRVALACMHCGARPRNMDPMDGARVFCNDPQCREIRYTLASA